MKKTIMTIFSFVLACHFMFAGGIVTNTNQSAAWVRSMVRDASVDVDAVFFNPAGLTHLEDGFYIQINSQTVKQTRTVSSTFPTLNNGEYVGTTDVPFLPTGFLAYKKGKLAISAGFTVIGGGGSAVFGEGLPNFEEFISTIPAQLGGLSAVSPALAITGYDVDIHFEGSSAYYGIQAGISYAINDMLSVAIGGRYIMANNAYTGHIKDISLVTGAGTMRADDFINNVAVPGLNQTSGDLAALIGAPDLIGPFLPIIGDFTPSFLQLLLGTGQIPPEMEALIEQYFPLILKGYEVLGLDPDVDPLNTFNGTVIAATPNLQIQKATIDGYAAVLPGQASLMGDQYVDVTQSGSGFTPIVSVDLDFLEGMFGLALKYEHKTSMKVTTAVAEDDPGLYVDEEEVTAEMPAMISVGLRVNPVETFRAQLGFHYYLDKNASYGRKDDSGAFVTNGEEATIGGESTVYLNSNAYEAAAGLEYDIHKLVTLSGGVLFTASDPNPIFQSGLSYTLNTMTFGMGTCIHVLDNFDIDLGYSNTSYSLYTKSLTDPNFGAFEETYDKTAWVFAAGLTYRF